MSFHNGLSFDTLAAANMARLPQFRNAKGELSHSEPDGSDWTPNDWMTAVTGEVGEAANVLKKVRRGDLSMDEARESLGKEFADIVTYLSILAMQCGVDLGDAVTNKFNEVSARVGSTVYIDGDDWHYNYR
jgi:Predicted pyrophosphatase